MRFWRLARTELEDLPARLHRARADFGAGPVAVLRHVARLGWRRGLLPSEIWAAGLADPAIPAERLAACIGKYALLAVQRTLNDRALVEVLRDKSRFYACCAEAGLPVPAPWVVLDAETRLAHNPAGSHPVPWPSLFASALPAQFVIKPARGAYGRGVRVFVRGGPQELIEVPGGRRWSAAELESALAAASRHRRWVVQERLHNHPELVALTGTETLQTVRVMTLVDAPGRCMLACPHLKIASGGSATDNYRAGRAGNMIAYLRSQDGVVQHVVGPRGPAGGVRAYETHPVTGRALRGVPLPWWPETRALLARAAEAFAPVRTIGWDVALTPAGPVLVEGNPDWDPPNDVAGTAGADDAVADMTRLIERMLEVSGGRRWWRHLRVADLLGRERRRPRRVLAGPGDSG